MENANITLFCFTFSSPRILDFKCCLPAQRTEMFSGQTLRLVTPVSTWSHASVQSMEFLCIYTSNVDELLAHESNQS